MVEITFNTEVSISDIIAGFSCLSIIVGGIFALRKWNINQKLKRAEYIKTLFDEIRSNSEIVFYLFEYDSNWYDEKFHNSKELERKIDYTLSYFSYICYLNNNKIITKSDLNYFRYELERILNNQQFKNYIYNLYHFSKEIKQPIPFVDLFQYAKDKRYFDDDFWDNKSEKYPHYLNF